MDSRRDVTERALARLALRYLSPLAAPRVLIGGLGMGYTLPPVPMKAETTPPG